jgi:hypothetical protein
MPFLADVQRGLDGAVQLARLDPSGMGRFDLTVEGFWRSFLAAVVASPFYLVLVMDQYGRTGTGPHLGEVVFAEVIGYTLGWVAFPVAAIFLTRLLGLGARYVALIVAGNWSAVLQAALLAATALVANMFADQSAAMIRLAATAVAVAYHWFVFRTALETTGGIAFGLVIVDLLLAVLLNLATDAWIQER